MTSSLAGVGALIRLILRRDRIRLTVWVAAVLGYTIPLVAGLPGLYPTEQSRRARAVIMDGPLGVAFSGPRIGLDDYTFAAMLSNEFLGLIALVFSLMSVLLVVRHTRAEEEGERAELVRAAAVGRHSMAAAALVVVLGSQLLIALALALALPATGLGLSTSGSWLFSFSLFAVGATFAGVATVASQMAGHSRGAIGMGVAILAAAYLIRAAGDIGDSALSMLSPFGWAQATRPFVVDAWWPLSIGVGVTAILMVAGTVLSTRRDLGAGLLQSRPGPARGSAALGTPLGLALRLQRGLLIGWGAGLFLLAAAYGGFLADVEAFAAENPFIAEMLAELGGATLGESWASFLTLLMMALVASFSVQAVLRLRSEETGLRAEPVLTGPVERWRWMGSHLMVAGLGSLMVALLVGLGFGLTGGAVTGDWSWIPRAAGATLSHLTALAVVAGFAVAVFGLLPRLAGLGWAMVVLVWAGLLGSVLGLPEWVSRLSPFGHGALYPAFPFEPAPFTILGLIAAGLVTAGIVAFGRRDVGVV